jgi:hypothetical protein
MHDTSREPSEVVRPCSYYSYAPRWIEISNEAAMEVGKGTGTAQHILATEKGEEIRRRKKRVGDAGGIYR